ncbi:MAG: ABC transporter permease [Solobacterium sp.]|nr:ABC transporter permease [Solobacterium sp.]
MKKYILTRIVKSIFSIFIVVSVVLVMIYTLIPRNKIFDNDPAIKKMKDDALVTYKNGKLDELGYLDYIKKPEMCQVTFGTDGYEACLVNGSEEQKTALAAYESKGYEIMYLPKSNDPYAIHDFSWFELLTHFYGKLFAVDGVNKIQDPDNPDLERKYYWGKHPTNGTPALLCSGCQYKYQLYFDGSFPFIHQNKLRLDFGTSYPINSGIPTMQVIGEGQGSAKKTKQNFETGAVEDSALIQTTCQYKFTTDHIDAKYFNDKYANCLSAHKDPSMINTSYIIGIISLLLAYVVALPAGISMAQHKDGIIDKIGIAYINMLIAIPSLAFIFFMRSIGTNFGLPDKFPQLGFGDLRSYIMPTLILALLSTPGLMMWLRRYMIDQSNSDYVKFARAKGLSQKEIFNRHILKNAIIPIVNGIPGSIILCISGALITESAFAVPGMGKMLPDALRQKNNTMVITLVFIFTTLSIFSVLAGDLLMTVVDPRISLTAKGGE